VLAISGLTGAGLDALWAQIATHRDRMEASGARREKRAAQQTKRLWALVDEALRGFVRDHAAVRSELQALEAAVRDGRLMPQRAAERVLALAGLDVMP
jgi:LAO/AO transport system kinase